MRIADSTCNARSICKVRACVTSVYRTCVCVCVYTICAREFAPAYIHVQPRMLDLPEPSAETPETHQAHEATDMDAHVERRSMAAPYCTTMPAPAEVAVHDQFPESLLAPSLLDRSSSVTSHGPPVARPQPSG